MDFLLNMMDCQSPRLWCQHTLEEKTCLAGKIHDIEERANKHLCTDKGVRAQVFLIPPQLNAIDFRLRMIGFVLNMHAIHCSTSV